MSTAAKSSQVTGGRRRAAKALLLALGLGAMSACSSSSTGGGGGGGGTIVFVFCPGDAPIWVAFQDGKSGSWTLLTPSNDSISFKLTSSAGGLAAVTASGGGFDLGVIYATKDQFTALSAYNTRVLGCESKTVHGTAANLANGEYVSVGLGTSQAQILQNGVQFSLFNVPNDTVDMVATSNGTADLRIHKYIVRRQLDVADGGSLDLLDFTSAEAFAKDTGAYTVTGLNGDNATVAGFFYGASGTETANGYLGGGVTDATYEYDAIPDAKVNSGEFQLLRGFTNSRSAGTYIRNVGPITLAFGPALSTPTVTAPTTSPYVMPNVTVASQTEYKDELDAFFTGSANDAFMVTTADYLGSTPTTWNVTFPDLSAAPNFQTNWGLDATDFDWVVTGSGGTLLFQNGAAPNNGDSFASASANGQNSSASGRRLGQLWGHSADRQGTPRPRLLVKTPKR